MRKITTLVAACGVALLLARPAMADWRVDEAREAQRRGTELHAKGDLEGALREFDRAVALVPEAPLAWFNRGLVRRALKNCPAAIEDFSRALALQPGLFNALYQRGNCFAATGAPQRAIEDYTQAISQPGRIDARFVALYARADAYRRLGRLEEAEADYTQVISVRTDTTALRSRAWVRFYAGRWDEAHSDAARYLHDTEGKEPDAAYALILGVLALRRNGELQRAAQLLGEWQARVKADRWLAALLDYLQKGDDATLLAAASSPGETTEARAYVGVNLLAQRDKSRGVELLSQVARNGDPSYLEYDLAYHELRRLGLAHPQDHKRWRASGAANRVAYNPRPRCCSSVGRATDS